MKRVLLSFVFLLPLLFSCSKDNGGADFGTGSIQKGENFDVAQTYSFTTTQENGGNQGGGSNNEVNFVTRTCVSTTSDGSFVAWDEDVEGTKAPGDILKKYNFRYGTYEVKVTETEDKIQKTLELTVAGEDKPFGAVVIESAKDESVQQSPSVTFVPANDEGEIPADEQGKIDTTDAVEGEITSSADESNPNEVITNGTWVVQETIALVRGANFSKPGMDVHAFAQWVHETLNLISENDVKEVEGYKVSNLLITDSMLTLCFENNKFFSSNVDIKNVQSFKIEDFLEKNSKVSEYINGTGSLSFDQDLCVLSIDGSIKGTKAQIALTLKRK